MFRKTDEFKAIGEVTQQETGSQFRHKLMIINKIKDLLKKKAKKYAWYIKKADTYAKAFREVVSQELFRLIAPRHPKTRIAVENKDYLILSKEVEGYQALTKDRIATRKIKNGLKSNDASNYVSGLGEILVLALWVNENDLKLGNLGFNLFNQIVKIDGEQSFAQVGPGNELWADKNFDITAQTIFNLPFNTGYESYHWLDQINGDKLKFDPFSNSAENLANINSSTIIPFDFIYGDPKNARFNQEVNETILKILMLTPELIRKFVNSYTEKDQEDLATTFSEFLIARQEQLLKSVSHLQCFMDYLNDETNHLSKENACNFSESLAEFKPFSNEPIFTNEVPVNSTVNFAKERFNTIRDQIVKLNNSSSTVLKHEDRAYYLNKNKSTNTSTSTNTHNTIDNKMNTDSEKTLEPNVNNDSQKTLDPNAKIDNQKTLDPNIKVDSQKTLDPNVKVDSQKTLDPNVKVDSQKTLDPNVKVDSQKTLDPNVKVDSQKTLDITHTEIYVPNKKIASQEKVPQNDVPFKNGKKRPLENQDDHNNVKRLKGATFFDNGILQYKNKLEVCYQNRFNSTIDTALYLAFNDIDLALQIQLLVKKEEMSLLAEVCPEELRQDYSEGGKIKRIQYCLFESINNANSPPQTPKSSGQLFAYINEIEKHVRTNYSNFDQDLYKYIKNAINYTQNVKMRLE